MKALNTDQRLLAIDPGSRLCGFAILTISSQSIRCLELGVVQPKLSLEFYQRIEIIHRRLAELATEYQVDHVAIEKSFCGTNPSSALKLGTARAPGLLIAASRNARLWEISPNEVKRAVTGQGHAPKEQVAKVLSNLLGIAEFPSHDASDALAIGYAVAMRIKQERWVSGGSEPRPRATT